MLSFRLEEVRYLMKAAKNTVSSQKIKRCPRFISIKSIFHLSPKLNRLLKTQQGSSWWNTRCERNWNFKITKNKFLNCYQPWAAVWRWRSNTICNDFCRIFRKCSRHKVPVTVAKNWSGSVFSNALSWIWLWIERLKIPIQGCEDGKFIYQYWP